MSMSTLFEESLLHSELSSFLFGCWSLAYWRFKAVILWQDLEGCTWKVTGDVIRHRSFCCEGSSYYICAVLGVLGKGEGDDSTGCTRTLAIFFL